MHKVCDSMFTKKGLMKTQVFGMIFMLSIILLIQLGNRSWVLLIKERPHMSMPSMCRWLAVFLASLSLLICLPESLDQETLNLATLLLPCLECKKKPLLCTGYQAAVRSQACCWLLFLEQLNCFWNWHPNPIHSKPV